MKRKMVFAALALLPLFVVLLLPSSAGAWHASYLRWITHDQPLSVIDYDEGFYNYDFTSQTNAQNGNSAGCDFPVTVLFTDDGEIWEVKDAYWGEATNHATMYNKCMEYNNQAVDSDKGTRSNNTYNPFGTHMRLYAWGGVYQYNMMIGAYSMGTTHYDKFDYIWLKQCAGWSEDCAEEIVQIARDKNYTVYHDCWILWNPEFLRTETSALEMHIWQCDGFASRVVLWP